MGEPVVYNADSVWQQMYSLLQQRIPHQFFSVFFEDLKLVDLRDNALYLMSSSSSIIDHLKKNYLIQIENAAHEVTGREMQVNLEVDDEAEKQQSEMKKEALETKQIEKTAPVRLSSYPNHIDLNKNYTFDKFVKGPSNEHAFAAAMGAAGQPKEYHNPLYLYGGVGLGKTHLMMAIGNYVQQQYPWMSIQYTPAETFQSDLVEAIRNKTLPHFKNKYRNVDVFLFDDIQLISPRADSTQEELFWTFNYLYQNRKQIVISGDRPPQQLDKLTDRLQSRFQSGLIVDIKPPNLETRIAILQSKAETMNLDIDYDVLQYLATRISSQIRALESALIKLKFTSDHEQHPVDMQMARLALKDMPNDQNTSQVTTDEILRVVSRVFHIDENEIKGASRVEQVVLARHTCMFLTRKLMPSKSRADIARAFGRNDHTTVLHAEKQMARRIDADDAFRIRIQELIDELQF